MVLVLSESARNAACNAIVDLVDAGAGAGTLTILTVSGAVAAVLTMSDPAFGDAAAGTATANAITDDSNPQGGIAASFVIKDSDGNTVVSGSVTVEGIGGDLELGNLTVDPAEPVSITALTITVPQQ